jgi:hypothetical protein
MLTKEEESFLEDIIEAIKAGQWIPNVVPNTLEWLAEKLKETNDELSRVTEELQKVNKEFAYYVEAHE